jgi:hypothetical protein
MHREIEKAEQETDGGNEQNANDFSAVTAAARC